MQTRYFHWQPVAALSFALALSACNSLPRGSPLTPPPPVTKEVAAASAKPGAAKPVLPRAGSGRGGYYQDDGPGDETPDGLENTPDAQPKVEPYSARGNKPYVVFGQQYTPIADEKPLRQRGMGSWYGKKFHGQKTSSGEPYDMYKMTAAHPTLPIPSYARVTNLSNNRQVIVRVNDRGPFHSSRIIDLSYTAALKLGYIGHGSTMLEVERLLPDEIARINAGTAVALKPAESVTPMPVNVAQVDAKPLESPAPAPLQLVSASAPAAEIAPAVFTPTAETIAPPAAPAGAAPATGIYLQFGAFSQNANAEAARNRITQRMNRLPPLEVVAGGSFHRIYSGPFASRAEAMAAAEQAEQAGIVKPLVVQR